MTGKKPTNANEPTIFTAKDPEDRKGALKIIGGSQSDHWNSTLANQVTEALWLQNSDAETREQQLNATVAALAGDIQRTQADLQRMIRDLANLGSANKLSRTWTSLLEALTAIAARDNRRSRLSTSMSMQADRPWSAWSKRQGVGIG